MQVINNPPIPFFAEINNGFPHFGEIDFHGEAMHGSHQGIWLELKTSTGIALHLAIRMGAQGHDRIVVNTQKKGKWGSEKTAHNSVRPDGPIRVHVECDEKEFRVNVNNEQIHCQQKVHAHEVQSLEIRGDVHIHELSFKGLENHLTLPHSHGPGYPH